MATISGENMFQPQAVGMKAVELPGRANYYNDMDDNRHPAIRPAKQLMARTLERTKKANERRGMVDRRMTEYANKLGVAEFVDAQHDGFVKDYGEMTRIVTGFLNSAKASLTAKAGVSDGPGGREIRDRLALMSNEDRINAIREAATNGDREVLGAVVGLSKLKTGINPEVVAPLYDDFQRREAPQEYQAVKDAEKYVGYIEAMPKDMFAWRVRALCGTEAQAAAQRTFDAIYTGFEAAPDAGDEAEAAD